MFTEHENSIYLLISLKLGQYRMTGLSGDGQYRLFRKMRGADLRRQERDYQEADKLWRRRLKEQEAKEATP